MPSPDRTGAQTQDCPKLEPPPKSRCFHQFKNVGYEKKSNCGIEISEEKNTRDELLESWDSWMTILYQVSLNDLQGGGGPAPEQETCCWLNLLTPGSGLVEEKNSWPKYFRVPYEKNSNNLDPWCAKYHISSLSHICLTFFYKRGKTGHNTHIFLVSSIMRHGWISEFDWRKTRGNAMCCFVEEI